MFQLRPVYISCKCLGVEHASNLVYWVVKGYDVSWLDHKHVFHNIMALFWQIIESAVSVICILVLLLSLYIYISCCLQSLEFHPVFYNWPTFSLSACISHNVPITETIRTPLKNSFSALSSLYIKNSPQSYVEKVLPVWLAGFLGVLRILSALALDQWTMAFTIKPAAHWSYMLSWLSF